jgi:hypothetical protein
MTLYCARFTFSITGKVVEERYATALERALAVIGYSSWADVEMWEE